MSQLNFTSMKRTNTYAMIQALAGAALFGASAPLAKILLGQVDPIPMAALLYLGAGLGVVLFKGAQRLTGQAQAEAPLRRADLPWLMGAILAGGVVAPIVLMFSLQRTPAATASLLLNFEGVATALLAALVFREAMGPRVWWAVTAVTTASILLSWDANGSWGVSLGTLGVLAACTLWGVDDNLTRNICGRGTADDHRSRTATGRRPCSRAFARSPGARPPAPSRRRAPPARAPGHATGPRPLSPAPARAHHARSRARTGYPPPARPLTCNNVEFMLFATAGGNTAHTIQRAVTHERGNDQHYAYDS